MTPYTPYTDFNYFLVLAAVSIPAVILGFLGKRQMYYTALATLCIIVYTFAPSRQESIALAGYIVFQLVVYKLYKYSRTQQKSEWVYRICMVLAILPLSVVKVEPWAVKVLHHPITPIGFLGISYLTFKSVQIIIETYDGLIKDINIFEYVISFIFFPTISSGPIDRSRRFLPDFHNTISSQDYAIIAHRGIDKIFLGFLYKFIIAYLINTYWLSALTHHPQTLSSTISYMYAYSFYLFFDFAGYSLFAIGFSYIFGIRTPENFNAPFISRNIKDFWNRWHMTLSFWFRDYIYMRAVIALTRKKLFRYKFAPSFIGYILLFGIMGIWHGLYLNYIVYGFYHAALMIGYDLFSGWNKRNPIIKNEVVGACCSIFITFNIICFGFLIFSGRLF